METPRKSHAGWYILLALFCLLVLWVPLYNRVEPTFIGLPFFYWFQLLLVLVGAALIGIVYFATEKK
jgi:uncharacterized protein DUF3311